MRVLTPCVATGTEKIRNFPTVNGNYTVTNATAGTSGAGFFLINGVALGWYAKCAAGSSVRQLRAFVLERGILNLSEGWDTQHTNSHQLRCGVLWAAYQLCTPAS
jgi:hypothetical protein